MDSITRGSDCEFGLMDGGHLVSALEVYGDTVETYPEGRVFADNMNVEIAIDPVTDLATFHRYTEALLQTIKDKGFELHPGPVLNYPDVYLDDPAALISGCMPDFCAYTGEENVAPDFASLGTSTRTLGAHVHASLGGARPDWYARWMDILVALPLLSHEDPSERRSMYGGPGCYREKPYGGEYRTLSSFWVQDEDLRTFIWNATNKAVALSATTDPSTVAEWWEIPQAIAAHDLALAERCFDRLYIYGLEVTS